MNRHGHVSVYKPNVTDFNTPSMRIMTKSPFLKITCNIASSYNSWWNGATCQSFGTITIISPLQYIYQTTMKVILVIAFIIASYVG